MWCNWCITFANTYLHLRHHPAWCTVSDNAAIPSECCHNYSCHQGTIVLSSCLHQHVVPETSFKYAMPLVYSHAGADPGPAVRAKSGARLGPVCQTGYRAWRIHHWVCWSGMVLPVGLTGMIWVLLEEPCCPCSCFTASAMALCNLNHLCQYAQVMHVRTYRQTDIHTDTYTRTHTRAHVQCSTVCC